MGLQLRPPSALRILSRFVFTQIGTAHGEIGPRVDAEQVADVYASGEGHRADLFWTGRPMIVKQRRRRRFAGAGSRAGVRDPFGGVIWQAGQHVGEPGLRIDTVEQFLRMTPSLRATTRRERVRSKRFI